MGFGLAWRVAVPVGGVVVERVWLACAVPACLRAPLALRDVVVALAVPDEVHLASGRFGG